MCFMQFCKDVNISRTMDEYAILLTIVNVSKEKECNSEETGIGCSKKPDTITQGGETKRAVSCKSLTY